MSPILWVGGDEDKGGDMDDFEKRNQESIEKLDKAFDGLSADIDALVQRHREVKAQRDELLKACKRGRPYVADHVALTLHEGPGDRIALDLMDAAIARAEGKR